MKYTNEQRRIAAVCVWKTGWECDAKAQTYIEKWRDGIRKNTIIAHPELFLLTDSNLVLDDVTSLPLIHNLPGWHSKFECFEADRFLDFQQVYYFDLDCIITGNLDGLFATDTEFAMLKDFMFARQFNSSLMSWKPGVWGFLLDKAIALNPPRETGDQGLIQQWVSEKREIDLWQEEGFMMPSFKADFIKNTKKLMGQILWFHGKPRPDQFDFDVDKLTTYKHIHYPSHPSVVRQELQKLRLPPPMGTRKISGHIIRDIPKCYKDQKVFIVGGGPSLKGVDLDRCLKGENVIAVNDAFRLKCAQICFFGDEPWWLEVKDEAVARGIPFYTTSGASHDSINHLQITSGGLPARTGYVGWNSNSGMCSLSLALQMGAAEVYLLGYDMHQSPTGENNWYPNHKGVPAFAYTTWLLYQDKMMKDFKEYWQGKVKVYNANPESSLTCFLKIDRDLLLNERTIQRV